LKSTAALRTSALAAQSDKSRRDPSVILGRRVTIQAISTGSREIFEQMNRAIARWRLHPVIERVFAFDAGLLQPTREAPFEV
jgi:hypothetical protein